MRTGKQAAIERMLSGDALREALAEAREEATQLRLCILAIAKVYGKLRLPKGTIQKLRNHDVVQIREDESSGDTHIEHTERK